MAGRKKVPEINQNVLNLITPPGLEFRKNYFFLGSNYAKAMVITRYPTNPDYCWLQHITAIEGTTAKVEFLPSDTASLVERCNDQIRQYRTDLPGTVDESVRLRKEKAIEDITQMLKRIDQDGEVVGYINVMLLVQAESFEKLTERTKKVQSVAATFGGGTRDLMFFQKEAYHALSPYGIPNKTLHDIGSRNMPLSTFIGGFINASSGINDGVGYMIGKSDQGKPIILDTRKRGGDRTNMNWFITGVPGVGKSSLVKLLSLMEYALGAKIIFLDPEREYVDLTKNLGGKVINCGGGAGGRINPLQARSAPTEEDKEDTKGSQLSDLALHFQTLRTFFRIYKWEITDSQIAKLEQVLEKTYKRFGITWETDVSKCRPKDFPVFSDMYEDLEKEAEAEPDSKELRWLLLNLHSIAKGADAHIFNGATDLETNEDMIDLDISTLMEGDEHILRAQMHNINSYVWHIASSNRNEIVMYVVDEGYLQVDPKYTEALIFLKNFTKRIRKYGGGIAFITHSVVDVLDEAVKRHGQALIDTACYKFIMGTDGKNLRDTKELFNLTEAEENLLLSKQRGRGLLYAGSTRINARIELPEVFLSWMGKAGGN